VNAILPFDGETELVEAWIKGIQPDPNLTIEEWSDAGNIILDAKGSAEAGAYSTSRTPFFREIFQNLSPSSSVITSTLMKGAQLGASQAGLNVIGHHIDIGGGPAIVVLPTIGMAELYSKQRLGPMIAASPTLSKKITKNSGKESGNTLLLKTFPGGIVRLTGANSAPSLKSMPAKLRIYEEPDEFVRDLEGQGHAIDLTRVRGRTYGRRAKEFINCTPTLKSDSIIWQLYLAGDQRLYTMPCPSCGRGTVWNKELFRFDPGRPDTARMLCQHCEKAMEEARHKTWMMEEGIWVPQVQDAPRDMDRSYYLPSFYSPIGWQSWEDIAREIEAAEGKYEKTKTLWNTTFGLPWNDITDTPSFEAIFERRSRDYRMRDISEDVLLLCAGIDVGIDHIEVGVWGFSRKGRRKLIEHIRIRGRYNEAETWQELDRFLQRRYWHPWGAALPVRRVFIDRGAWPSVVDPWVRKQDPDWVTAIKGVDTVDFTIKETTRREKMDDGTWARDLTFKYFMLGVTMLKLELYGQLNLKRDAGQEEPPGWVDLPEDVEIGWVEQLVSEDYVTVRGKKGRSKSHFQPQASVRQEALDTTNYARAAAYSLGWDNWGEPDFLRLEKEIRDTAARLQLELARRQSNGRVVDADTLVGGIVRARPVAAVVPEIEQVSVVPAPQPEVAMTPIDTEKKNDEPGPSKDKANDPWAGVSSSWGGHEETKRPDEIGIVGCKTEPQTSVLTPKIRTAWDNDDDDI